MSVIISESANPLRGTVRVPGDKSVSHRALMFGALAVGETNISGLLEGDDVLATAAAMRALGAQVTRGEDGTWQVFGCGVGGLAEPGNVLDMGNSGTAVRLLMGVLAGHAFPATLTGDASLRSRPMERIMKPLRDIGATFVSAEGGRLPITMTGAVDPLPTAYEMPMASAQVKSAVLLAGLSVPGETVVIEPVPTRDHTERLLRHFGADVRVEDDPDGRRRVTLVGEPELEGRNVVVPADISSAAFPMVAALLVPGSAVTLTGVGTNPLRAGLMDTLRDMGGDLRLENSRDEDGEPVADVVVRAAKLRGVDVPAGRVPSMIDEFPVLAVCAAHAEGTTRMTGLSELRVKESDRLAAMAQGLSACGVALEETEDTLTIFGDGKAPAGGAEIDSDLDHRIAMAFLVLGMASRDAVRVAQAETIATSFPGFADMMNGLGANMSEAPS
ncbi:MAG: 3-phosphoshikimate 1-carboxyvinyltransferase [Rhodospirillaceae bacterium]|nr:3-phosphoshikimate 1-carboxyvinyltransferase [Rhodospirillaceae bacterium]MBT5514787.1 3-phosphoshikimate 1-carboxyvinyltransferase [Rhodospirillaceae bacterium]MBT6084998.1 3-phosphoshikimate 1-carboxyvinyltransferase [Rhodospirillaceae bacterium]MBT6608566.1 3-phosphoshikimate 1-carboxyvinyltransferase [Rhodospirillaceae bacterium]MBT7510508.1 3-phosphoshikimate 1-carboxyvinyltransferase [Rhodospirillaceae bacterium]